MLVPFKTEYRLFHEKSHREFIEPILKVAYKEPHEFEVAILNILTPISYLLGSELKKTKPMVN